MTEPLRLLQVGLGDWGRDWAWRVIPTVDEVELVGYVDSDPRAFALLDRKLPGSATRGFRSLDEAIDATRPEALLITTTLGSHAALIRAALDAGLHVLVEKPFVETLERAQALVDVATARALTLMVSQNYRCFPAARTAARLVQDAALGELIAVSIGFRRDFSSPPKPAFRLHTDPQPLLVDMSIHHFDLLRLMFGRDPDRVFCVTSSAGRGGFAGPPTADAVINFGDVVVSYRASWISAASQTAWAGEWNMEFDGGHVYWTSRGDRGVLKDRVVVTPRDGKRQVMDLPAMSRIDRAGTLTEFAAAVRERREPETSGRDNLATLAFTFAAVDSSTRLQWVEPAAAGSTALIR